MIEDIPLADAQVIWSYQGREPDAPSVLVIGSGVRDDDNYDASWGACHLEFAEADDAGKLFQLFQQFHQLVTMYGLDPMKVHEAFLVIPEYREALADRGLVEMLPPEYR